MTEAAKAELRRIDRDIVPFPDKFSRVILQADIWSTQAEIMRAVDAHRLVAVKACHASGKTFMAARLALWWLAKWNRRGQRVRVITTAPTLRQVKLMWEEIHMAATLSKLPFPEPGSLAMRLSDECYAMGFSSARGVNAQGFHGDRVLVIEDEAPGIEQEVHDAIEGISAGGDVRILRLGNPVVPAGAFYDAFNRERASWQRFTISALNTPNLEGVTLEDIRQMDAAALAIAPTPYLVTRSWVRDKIERWGIEHPKFRSRVLGEFPPQSPYSVFTEQMIQDAKREMTEADWGMLGRAPKQAIQCGIDVAGPGEDETTIAARAGGLVLGVWGFEDADPRGAVLRKLKEIERDNPKFGPLVAVVDVVGIGYNFYLHLIDNGINAVPFNAGMAPLDKERFMNAKAEAHWGLRDRMRQKRVRGLDEEETEAQLSGIFFRETPSGRTQIEPKDESKKRGMKSPDRAEALVMAFDRLDRVQSDHQEQFVEWESIAQY